MANCADTQRCVGEVLGGLGSWGWPRRAVLEGFKSREGINPKSLAEPLVQRDRRDGEVYMVNQRA